MEVDTMAQERVTIRVSSRLVEDIDQLTEELAELPTYSPTGKMSRSECLRLCVMRGLEDIKRELEESKK